MGDLCVGRIRNAHARDHPTTTANRIVSLNPGSNETNPRNAANLAGLSVGVPGMGLLSTDHIKESLSLSQRNGIAL
jgi:hypothetical protein